MTTGSAEHPPPLSEQVSTLRHQAAANARWANEPDRTAATQAARDGRWRKFLEQVDPAGLLEPAERARRAKAAQSQFMSQNALDQANVRRATRKRLAAEHADLVEAARLVLQGFVDLQDQL